MRHLKIHRYSFIHQGGAGTVRVVSSSTTQRNVLDQGRRRMVSALDSKSSALTMRPLCRDKKFEIETSLSYVMLLIATSCKLRAKRLCSIYQQLQTETLGQCTDFKAVPGYGLSCKVSGVEELIKPKTVLDKNKKNLSVKVDGIVMDESQDIDPASVISGSDNGEI